MTEANISAYDNFIMESAEQYLQTVVLIDDRIYENKSGSVASHLTTPPATRRKPALKSSTSSSAKSDKEIEKVEVSEEPDEVSFHDVQNSFAKKHIICSLYQPEKSASFDEQSEVYKLCSTADVVIVDWDLDDPSGGKATTLVRSLVEQSRVGIPYQLRLVLIYTLEANLQSVSDKIFESLLDRLNEDGVAVDPQSEGLVLITENARVVVLGKRENTTLTQFSDYWVPESDLATRTIREFSRLASGLLQGIVLRGIANLRKNNRRILARFRRDLDMAFLTHRALLLPDEAFGQIIPLLTDELHAVLEDMLGESPLGKASAVRGILVDWCDKHKKLINDAELSSGDGTNSLEFWKDVFCNGAKTKNERKTLSKNKEADDCHEKLGSLMSQRARYDNSQRALHLGVIVRELADEERYLLCLQPVCDSVRMGDESRAFIFCVLKESEEDFTHCVVDGGNNVIKLAYKPKVSSIFVSNFKGNDNDDAVYANKDNGGFIFKDEGKDGNDYKWIAELKAEHAQRAAEQFGRELSRVGLAESEWLRIKAK